MTQMKSMNIVSFSSWNGNIIDNRNGISQLQSNSNGLTENYKNLVKDLAFNALISSNGLIIKDSTSDIPSLIYTYLKTIRKLSCGECSVCTIGIEKLINIFDFMGKEITSPEILEEINNLVKGIIINSKCNYGSSAVLPVYDAINYYKNDFLKVIQGECNLKNLDINIKVDAPCINACPISLDIPGYINFIKNGNFKESLDLIRKKCILPGVIGRSCPATCEKACVRKDIDDPLSIRLLKRAVADYDLQKLSIPLTKSDQIKDEKIAIIGAGPAGLAAAYKLCQKGYKISVFETNLFAGGMASIGIPDYRLPKNILNYEIDLIQRMGVKIEFNVSPEKINIDSLKRKGFKAIIISIGAQNGTKIGCVGEDKNYFGFIDGVKFLKNLRFGKQINFEVKKINKVLIIGGGNVAFDCARSCKRLGYEDVTIVYRRSRAEMPAHQEEIEAAEQEHIKFLYLTAPIEIIADKGKITGMKSIRMELGEMDNSGRYKPIPIKNSEFFINSDLIISAIGQKIDSNIFAGLDLTSWGTIKVNQYNYMTNIDGVFAGGDCVLGPATLVEALNAGNSIGESVDYYLQSKQIKNEIKFDKLNFLKLNKESFICKKPKLNIDCLDPNSRIKDFSEIESGFSTKKAIEEAKRCLRCYRVIIWQ